MNHEAAPTRHPRRMSSNSNVQKFRSWAVARWDTRMRILLVEDEPKIAAFLHKGLAENGFVVDLARQGDDGLHLARTGAYDLVILDVMLPNLDGWAVLSALRQEGKQTPVLYLTARDPSSPRAAIVSASPTTAASRASWAH
jgi:CheY-like chemotaxis protein